MLLRLSLALVLAAPGALAQDAPPPSYPGASQEDRPPRVLRTWSEPVKLDAGAATYHHAVVFDYATGETRRVTRDDAGRLVADVPVRPVRPTPAEVDEAAAILLGQPRFRAMRAARPFEADGGFLLVEDAGAPCGPGSRCLQLDLLDAADRTRRVGYAVVDLVTGAVVYPDFDPSRQGNRR